VKKILVAVAVVAAVGVAYAGGTYVAGSQIERRLQAQTDAITAQLPMLQVTEQSHERGLLSSTRLTTYRLGCADPSAPTGAPEPIVFTVRDRIEHGPLPGGRSVGLAVIESELVLSGDAQARIAKHFGDRKPLEVRTVVGVLGDFTTELTSPAIELQGAKGEQIRWQGLTGSLRADADGTEVSYEVRAPGLEIVDPRAGGRMALSGARFGGRVRPVKGSLWVAPGQGEGEIAAVELTVQPGSGGEGKPAAWNIALRDVRFTSDATVADDLLGMHTTVTGTGSFGETRLDRIELEASVRRLHVPSYQKVVSAFMGASCDAEAQRDPGALMGALQPEFAQILVHGPEYAVDKVAIELEGKRGELSYSAAVEGATAEDAALPAPVLLTTKGTLKADAKLPHEWVLRLAALMAAQSKQPAGPEAVAQVVDGLVAQGLAVREGDLLRSSVRFVRGALTVNGREVPLPR
jgi:uncharacterized protein YdgA (DUF945 family)